MKTAKEKPKTKARIKINTGIIVFAAMLLGASAAILHALKYGNLVDSVDPQASSAGNSSDTIYDNDSIGYCYMSGSEEDTTFSGYAICTYDEGDNKYHIVTDPEKLARYTVDQNLFYDSLVANQILQVGETILGALAIVCLLGAVVYYNHNRS